MHSFSSAILRGYVSHGLMVSIHDICTLFHRLTAISGHLGSHLCQASFWPMHVCVSAHVGGHFRGKKTAWHFWLVKLNMWLPSSKADPCPPVAKLAFKSTNVHLQLLLLRDHLLWSRARARTHELARSKRRSELLLQGSSNESLHFFIDLFIKCNFNMLTVVIQ